MNALAAPTTAAAPSTGGLTNAADTEQRFLKMLTAQLNNQDPLNPMDNAQLTAQLAQLETVSGIEKLNTTMQSLLGQSSNAQILQAASMVGRTVLAPGQDLVAGDGPTDFAVDLPASAGSVKAVITNAAGTPVRTVDLGALPAGVNSATWPGDNDSGAPVPAGPYRLQVVAANGSAAVPATTLVYAQVSSVAPSATGVSLDLKSGQHVALSDVRMLR